MGIMNRAGRVSRLFWAVGLLLAVGCSDSNGPHQGLNIVSGDNQVDTVNSYLSIPLTIQVLNSDHQPNPQHPVRFGSNGIVLISPISDPGFLTNGISETTDANGEAAVLLRFKQYAGRDFVQVTDQTSNQFLRAYYTVLPGAPALVHADPSDTTLYVGGIEAFRPFVTDAYGNRLGVSPTYQYQSLNNALAISAPGKVMGVAFGRGSVVVSALGFTDTVWASVVPQGRLVVQGNNIIRTNLDGSAFDTIPSPTYGGRSLDWSAVNGTLVYDVSASDGRDLISLDMTGHAHPVVTDPLMRNEFYPRYTRDGSYIYFTGVDSLSNCWGVWRVYPDGMSLEHVVADTVDCGPYVYQGGPTPSYASSPSPDGTRIVYVGGRNIPYLGGTLRVRTLATGADTSLGVMGQFPRWSPTGEWIAYDSTGMLMLIHPDGTGHQPLLYRGDYFNPAVAWSPDGQWLVFYGFNYYGSPDKPTGFEGLKVVQIATGLKLPLHYAAGLTNPTWQP